MKTTFADFAKGFWDKPTRTSKPRPITLRYTDTPDSEPERLQLTEQVAGIIQELHNLLELTDTDRRALNISRAVEFLLERR